MSGSVEPIISTDQWLTIALTTGSVVLGGVISLFTSVYMWNRQQENEKQKKEAEEKSNCFIKINRIAFHIAQYRSEIEMQDDYFSECVRGSDANIPLAVKVRQLELVPYNESLSSLDLAPIFDRDAKFAAQILLYEKQCQQVFAQIIRYYQSKAALEEYVLRNCVSELGEGTTAQVTNDLYAEARTRDLSNMIGNLISNTFEIREFGLRINAELRNFVSKHFDGASVVEGRANDAKP